MNNSHCCFYISSIIYNLLSKSLTKCVMKKRERSSTSQLVALSYLPGADMARSWFCSRSERRSHFPVHSQGLCGKLEERRGEGKHEREEGRDINQKGGGELYWNRKWPQQNQSNITVHSPYSVTQSCVTVCNHYIMCLVHLYKSTGQYMFYHHIIAQKSKGPCPLWRRSMWQWGLKSFVADEALRAETRDTVGVRVCQVWTEAAH